MEHLLVVLDDTPFTLWGPGSCEILGNTVTEAIGDLWGTLRGGLKIRRSET